jgi:hypothetical protein
LEGLHRLLLGDPTAKVVTSGLPRPYAAVAAGIAAQIPLPIDGPFMLIKMGLQVAGMAVGLLAPGQPPRTGSSGAGTVTGAGP